MTDIRTWRGDLTVRGLNRGIQSGHSNSCCIKISNQRARIFPCINFAKKPVIRGDIFTYKQRRF